MESRKIVGRVTLEETNEIRTLFERKNALAELAKIISADNTQLYEKLIKDVGETGTKFQSWWDAKSKHYGWESHPNGNWEVNFETGDITLIIKD